MTCYSQLPATLNLTAYIGATFSEVLIWSTGDPALPVDLTDYTADMKVKSGSATILELSTTNGRITLGGVAGTITLTVSATDTATLTASNAEYDLLLTSPTDVVTPLVAGNFLIRKGTTV